MPGARLGDPAPAVTIERWIKGAPVKFGPRTNLLVVEFWATWCPPCRESIPHLTALQKKYSEKGVVFISISKESVNEVAQFVANQGDNMAYRVAVDSSGRTQNLWFGAYSQSGIPHAFVVNTNGAVLWHGFPDEDLDLALEQITTGKYDLERAQNFDTGDQLVKQYTALVSKSKTATNAASIGEKILSEHSREWRIPYRLAKAILTEPAIRVRDLDLALRAANKAVELTRERSYQSLEMQARALFATGKKQQAIEVQKKAIDVCKNAEDLEELKKFLGLYEKSAQRPTKS